MSAISDGIRPVGKNLFSKFVLSREPVIGLNQGFSILPHEHLQPITYFGKPLIDLLLTFNSEKQDYKQV